MIGALAVVAAVGCAAVVLAHVPRPRASLPARDAGGHVRVITRDEVPR